MGGDPAEGEEPDVFRMFTTSASNDLPTSRLPILPSRLHTCAPPRVASQSKVGIVSGLDAKESGFDDSMGDVIAMILAAIDACWMAVRIEGENPPETSVPRPTCENSKVRERCRGPHEAGEWTLISLSNITPTLATPLVRLKLLVGQWLIPLRLSFTNSSSSSSKCTACARIMLSLNRP